MTCYAVQAMTNAADPKRIDSIHAARLIRENIATRHVVIYQLPDQEPA